MTGAPGRLLLFSLLFLVAAWALADCGPPDQASPAIVERVVDGDTLIIEGGERIRIIGLDTPELGRRGEPDEPFAREAREHLATLVSLSTGKVSIAPGVESRDRYGRLLARVFTERHGELATHQVGNGFGFAVAIAPNTDGADCHFDAERRAREAALGLWSSPVILDAAAFTGYGFAIVVGEVIEVRRRRDDTLLTLDGGAVVRLLRGGFEHDPRALTGRRIEVRGWFHPWGRAGRAVTISHPRMITVRIGDDI